MHSLKKKIVKQRHSIKFVMLLRHKNIIFYIQNTVLLIKCKLGHAVKCPVCLSDIKGILWAAGNKHKMDQKSQCQSIHACISCCLSEFRLWRQQCKHRPPPSSSPAPPPAHLGGTLTYFQVS